MLAKIFPFILWFKDYNGGKLKVDVLAGITVAMVLIPQSMAYAQLAGLPPYYGLYAAFLPPMVAALFGSSRQLATGPVAVVSLLSAASLEPLATAGGAEFIAYSVILALTVGCFQLFLGVFRLGLIVNLLSHPVVNGFTNAAAIVIASSQFSKLFGVYVDKASHHYQTIINVVISAFHYTHLPTLGMAVLAIAIMVGLKRVNPRIPNVLVAVAVTILLSYFTGFNNDKTISIKKIQAPGVETTINEFNTEIATIERLGTQRANLNNVVKGVREESKARGLSIVTLRQLDLEHQLAVLNSQIDKAKVIAHDKRETLRLIHFLIAENAGDDPVFYVASTLPKGMETDGHKWRLKVKNSLLNVEKLYMMGAGAVVGTIPEGLVFAIPRAPKNTTYLSAFLQLLPFAIIISLVGFMEAIAIAKSMAAKTGQKLDPNQELIGQGLANIIGSFGQSYAVSGSFSRSSVNLQANAVSGISSVVTSIVVAITLLFFTPLLYHLPQSVLASVIMMAVIGLVNVDGFVHAWKAKRSDGVISVIAFACTLYFAPHLHEGILVGVALTFIVFLYKTLRPKVATVAEAEDHAFHITKENQEKCEHIAVVRFDGALIFANATYLEDKVLEYIAETPTLSHIIIGCSGIVDLDASGEAALSILVDTVRGSDRHISFCRVKEEVFAVLERTNLLEKIGEKNIFIDGRQAINAAYKAIHEKDGCSHPCPLLGAE